MAQPPCQVGLPAFVKFQYLAQAQSEMREVHFNVIAFALLLCLPAAAEENAQPSPAFLSAKVISRMISG